MAGIHKTDRVVEGIVTEATGDPNPHSFTIEAKNEKNEVVKYFAFLGDIKANEELLYAIERGDILGKDGKKILVATLKKGDKVELEPKKHRDFGTTHAIHVRKKN